ncbi:hypothetical protein [Fodinicola acaciae]|uniref:aa3-type cytochrome oxidase subunit CtaJ n=1 Tax=Fodinicola acaciae TaxID=2681555 RepID=UPI0013D1C0B9|nr:hypothetical protein [Fodinicola acaciae]
MTPLEIVGIFVGIPAAVVLVIAALVYGTSARRSTRYRPGRPFDFAPVWFLAAAPDAGAVGAPRTTAGQLEAAAQESVPAGQSEPAAESKGGASGSW